MSQKEQMPRTQAHMQPCDLAVSPSLDYWSDIPLLTHLWDSQPFVALGTPWGNRPVCWVSFGLVYAPACEGAFAFSR